MSPVARARVSAIVLAGGAARRLGGASKPGLVIGDDTLLDLAVAACAVADAKPVVVVGPPDLARDGVVVTREDPTGGGPVAGLAAGLAELSARCGGPFGEDDLILALACDMPRAADAVAGLMAAVGPGDGAWVVDDEGRPQPLLAVYRAQSLAVAVAELQTATGAAMRDLVRNLDMAPVLGLRHTSDDVDTWEDARRHGAHRLPGSPGEES